MKKKNILLKSAIGMGATIASTSAIAIAATSCSNASEYNIQFNSDYKPSLVLGDSQIITATAKDGSEVNLTADGESKDNWSFNESTGELIYETNVSEVTTITITATNTSNSNDKNSIKVGLIPYSSSSKFQSIDISELDWVCTKDDEDYKIEASGKINGNNIKLILGSWEGQEVEYFTNYVDAYDPETGVFTYGSIGSDPSICTFEAYYEVNGVTINCVIFPDFVKDFYVANFTNALVANQFLIEQFTRAGEQEGAEYYINFNEAIRKVLNGEVGNFENPTTGSITHMQYFTISDWEAVLEAMNNAYKVCISDNQ